MTLIEPSAGRVEGPLGERWRAEAARAQESGLADGRFLVSCPAAVSGAGGLGRHLEEIADALERSGRSSDYISGATRTSDLQATGHSPRAPARAMLARSMRFSPAWRYWRTSVEFDSYAARVMRPADHFVAFNSTSLAQLRAAKQMRFKSISLVAANSHFRRVTRQHERARRQYPLEGSWSTRLLKRNLLEYKEADRILVASRYVWESFVEEGFPEDVLSLFPLTPDPRYAFNGAPRSSTTFDIVYVGSLSVAKGVPLLIDAVRRLAHDDIRLVLVGGWRSRGMRRFVEQARVEDPRIEVAPGDPLPRLREARLCVHPAYEDGFAYAPAEALACGVPVIVSEDTGMKDLIDSGRDGLILPTGDRVALTEAIEAAYRGEILRG
jgi:glycosyltransferase involved in cell wall biosynthesis